MAKVAVLDQGSILGRGPDMDEVQSAIQQLVGRLSSDKCLQLWRAASQGVFGRGPKADAVRRGIVGHMNVHRQDHARRLFLSALEPLLAHDVRLLALGGMPGLLHIADLGALFEALRQDVLSQLANNAQQYLETRCRQEPVSEAVAHSDAVQLRDAMMDAARPMMDAALADETALRRLTQAINTQRRDVVRMAADQHGLDVLNLDLDDVRQMALAVRLAPSLSLSALKAANEVEGSPEMVARRFLEVRARLESALPDFARNQGVGLWPALAALHRGASVGRFGLFMEGLVGADLDRLGRVINGHARMENNCLRRLWRAVADGAPANAELLTCLSRAITRTRDVTEIMLLKPWRGHAAISRSTHAHIQEMRSFVVEVSADVMMDRIIAFAKNPKTKEPEFQRLRALVGMLNQSGLLGTEEMKRNRALERWRQDVMDQCQSRFKQAFQDVPEPMLLGHMVRLMMVAREAGNDPDPWIFVSSLSLTKGAKAFFSGRAVSYGKGTGAEMEMLAIRLLKLAHRDQEQQIQWKDQELVELRIAGTRWAEANNRDIKELVGDQDVTE